MRYIDDTGKEHEVDVQGLELTRDYDPSVYYPEEIPMPSPYGPGRSNQPAMWVLLDIIKDQDRRIAALETPNPTPPKEESK